MDGPQFFFAYVDGSQTMFDPATMCVVDDTIFSVERHWDEAQIPFLLVTILNPRVGLLARNGGNNWAWWSYQPSSGSGVIPLFFGVLESVPDDLEDELITLKFIARSPNYIQLKQALAETLKQRPYWDPVTLDGKYRDQLEAILEGWSVLPCVDPVTLEVSASDVLIGEDGVITFDGTAWYDNFHYDNTGAAPLTNVQVRINVHWTQRFIGYVALPSAQSPGTAGSYQPPLIFNPYGGEVIPEPSSTSNLPVTSVASYTGETFMNTWPKPGAQLGGGWRCEYSFVDDIYKVGLTPTVNASSIYTADPNLPKINCNPESITSSSSFPALLSPNPITGVLTEQITSGLCQPQHNPPINSPASAKVTGVIVPEWFLACQCLFRYDAQRIFTETTIFDVIANVQKIELSPTVEQHTETITIDCVDVSQPLIDYDAWSDFAGQPVQLAQIIWPNNPTTPGGLSFQVCVKAGNAGVVEPVFSDIPGTITYDPDINGVWWASMGTSPLNSQPGWTSATFVPCGQIICYEPVAFDPETGEFETTGQGVFYININPAGGETNSTYTYFSYIPPVVDSDEPTPVPVQIAYIAGPAFDATPGDIVNDGSVQWMVLGTAPALLGIPLGGTMTRQPARSYMSTDRGAWTLEAGICRARSRLRWRSRAVVIKFDAPFELVAPITLRQNVTIVEPRIPGGVATGKVISTTLHFDGDGEMYGHVEIGVPVGLEAEAVEAEPGTPEIAIDGAVFEPGVQIYYGALVAIADDESIGYTPITFQPFDDGLLFPLQGFPGNITISGSAADQVAPIEAAIAVTREIAEADLVAALGYQLIGGIVEPIGTLRNATGQAWMLEEMQFYNTANSLPYVMEANPVSAEIIIPPVTNGPFSGSYAPAVTALNIPMGIDLSAGSHE